jgi:hypothetical protein
MPNKKQPIVPVFRGERYHGETIEGIYFPSREQSYIELKEGGAHPIKPETLQMSLNGKEWYSMEEIEEALNIHSPKIQRDRKINLARSDAYVEEIKIEGTRKTLTKECPYRKSGYVGSPMCIREAGEHNCIYSFGVTEKGQYIKCAFRDMVHKL